MTFWICINQLRIISACIFTGTLFFWRKYEKQNIYFYTYGADCNFCSQHLFYCNKQNGKQRAGRSI